MIKLILSILVIATLQKTQKKKKILDAQNNEYYDINQKPTQDIQDYEEIQQQIEKKDKDLALNQEWEMHMDDFVPSDIVTFKIASKTFENFFEAVPETNSYVRGAIFVTSNQDHKVMISIVDPQNNEIYQNSAQNEHIFYFNTTMPGQYTFLLKNIEKNPIVVTFAVQVKAPSLEIVQGKDIDPIQERLTRLDTKIHQLNLNSLKKNMRHIYNVLVFLLAMGETNNGLLFFTMIETFAVILASSLQIYNIKKLLNNRRIV